jgi:catechol 2,3-dioxygenase-like lactoylglutathione lyase family enzyme
MKTLLVFLAGVLAGAAFISPGIAQNQATAQLSGTAPGDALLPRPNRALNHIGIVVADYDAAYEFYTEVMGLKEAYTVERNGQPFLTYLQLNRETFVELIPARAGQATGITHFGMEVGDIDATVAELRAHGLSVDDPGVTPANARYFRVNDVDNVEIEVMQYGPESSQYKAMQAWDR